MTHMYIYFLFPLHILKHLRKLQCASQEPELNRSLHKGWMRMLHILLICRVLMTVMSPDALWTHGRFRPVSVWAQRASSTQQECGRGERRRPGGRLCVS